MGVEKQFQNLGYAGGGLCREGRYRHVHGQLTQALARGGAVVVKTAKPNQDTRFDMPAIGLQTLRSMEESGCAVLAIEAYHTLFAEKDEVLKEANNKGIVILAAEQDSL